ncbi:unnamed protein product [Spodoptera exigua]|nr:unnamed protein product [Spodoptera exigua]
MNIPEIKSYQEQAIDTVVSVINRAKEKLGVRQTLRQLANSREFACNAKLSLKAIGPPFAITCEKFILKTIEKKWKLADKFMYVVRYMGESKNEVSQYYYFEAIFSQPTASYPIPQATVSVFFILEDKHTEPTNERGVPMLKALAELGLLNLPDHWNETSRQTQARQAIDAERHAAQRAAKTSQQSQARQIIDAERHADQRAADTQARQILDAEHQASYIAAETSEETRRRRLINAERQRRRRMANKETLGMCCSGGKVSVPTLDDPEEQRQKCSSESKVTTQNTTYAL